MQQPLISVPALISTVVASKIACAICDATVRFQISSYRRIWSELRKDLRDPGVRIRPVGRIASWASWAFLLLLRKKRGFAKAYSVPYCWWINRRATLAADSHRASAA